ncbi:MAG TPA: carboxypeptidase regulatory-like domain-containing protein [Terriglobia bacterium]|jgi:hypothetical protein
MFSKTRSLMLVALVIVGLVGAVPGLFAQASDGVILGTVTDATQAVIPNAMVAATNKATGIVYTATTNSVGEFRINNAPVGTYDVNITASGMTPQRLANVQVELNRTSTENITMQVSSVSADVVVREAPPLIDSSTSQLETTFKADQAVNQPMAGNFINDTGVLNLSLLAPGVTQSGGMGYGEGPSVGGQRQTNNAFFVDGVDNNRHDVTGPTVTVPNDAVAQFSILENQFSPEFGGASGGIFNIVTQSGTNDIHGSLYEYVNNRNMNALDGKVAAQGFPAPGVRIPRLDYNRVGGTVGGPIIKNKLFYFGDYEYSPEGQASVPGSPIVGPTAAGFATIAGLPGISATNLGILTKYLAPAPIANAPSITVGGVAIPTGSISVSGPSFFNKQNIVASIDYDASNSDKIRGRYIYNRYNSIDTFAQLPVFYTPVPDNRHLFSISEFHTFSATALNEFRVSYSRKNNNFPVGNFTFPGLDQFPNLQFDDLNLQVGPDSSAPQGYIQGQLQANENFTKTFSRHTVKAGYQFLDVIASNSFIQRERGDYDYTMVDLYLHDLSPDSEGERSVGVTGGTPAGYLFHSMYVNDDFRVKPNLTLNLGLRYEYMTVPVLTRYQKFSAPANVPGLITFAEPTPQKTNWAPKIGFAWTPSGRTDWAVRGGFSLNYDLTYNNLNINAKPAYFQQTHDVDLTMQTPNFLKNGGLLPSNAIVITTDPVAARAAVASFMPNEQIRPYSINYTVSIQRSFGSNYTIEARYLGTKGVHLFVQDQLNRISNITPTNGLPTYFTMPSLATLATLPRTLGGLQDQLNAMTGGNGSNSYAAAGFPNTITAYEPIGNSKYNGLALQLIKRYTNNFSYAAAFTWSHALDDSTATVFSTELTPRRGQDFGNMRNDWSTSALDRRLRFTFAPVYDFKPFSNGSWLLKNVVGNWNITGSYTFQSPEYATVQSGVDSNLNNDTAGDRAVVNTSGQALLGSDVTPYNAAGAAVAAGDRSIVAYVANHSNARYVVAGLGAFPNAGRNTYPLRRTDDVDFQLMKRFGITEKTRFEVAGQIFNIFNHPQFTGDLLNDVYPNQNNTTRSFLLVNNPEFGHFEDGFFTSNPRQITVVGRIVF